MPTAQQVAALPALQLNMYCVKCEKIWPVSFPAGRKTTRCGASPSHVVKRPIESLVPVGSTGLISSRRTAEEVLSRLGEFGLDRRTLGALVVSGIINTVIAPYIARLESFIGHWADSGARAAEAKNAFAEFFNPYDGDLTLNLGKYYDPEQEQPHKNHQPVALALKQIFDVVDLHIEISSDLATSSYGDLMLVGGAASTPLAGLALGYTGNYSILSGYELAYTSLLPLPWYTLYDSSKLTDDTSLGWTIEGQDVSTHNWQILPNGSYGRMYVPIPHRTDTVTIGAGSNKRIVKRLGTDYLLLTRLPNFLDPRFEDFVDPIDWISESDWPRMTIIGGTHGVGTMATELLMKDEGAQALADLRTRVSDAIAYQAVFEVSEIDIEDGFHRARKIELVDSVALPIERLGRSDYLRAHHQARVLIDAAIARQSRR